ncbi:MAG TPA: hypothetical protein VGX23_00810 [Actinocrinis sp.]|nr:hypothetical protein [Actinocrinis sp.]
MSPNHAATPVPSPTAEPARSGLNRRRFLIATGATGLGAVSGVLWARAGSNPTTPTATGDPTTPTTVGTATWAPAGSTPAGAQAVAFSPDGNTLAVGSWQDIGSPSANVKIQLWNLG